MIDTHPKFYAVDDPERFDKICRALLYKGRTGFSCRDSHHAVGTIRRVVSFLKRNGRDFGDWKVWGVPIQLSKYREHGLVYAIVKFKLL